MRIAVVSTMAAQPWTGSEELWADMAEAALGEGHQVALSLFRWPETPPRVAQLEKLGARIFWRKRPGKLPTFNGIINRLVGKRVVLPLPRASSPFHALFAFRPDVLCWSQGWVYEFVDHPDLNSKITASSVPLVLLGQANVEGAIAGDTRRAAREFFPRAARLAFVSHGNFKATERQLAMALPQGVVVRNPVNLTDSSAVRWPRNAPDELRMACVGRLDVGHKAQDVLLEALSAPIWRERAWKLRLFGGGEERAYIEELIEHYGLGSRVEFGGHVPDVRAIWADHHLLVLPSRLEGTPLAMMEAMLCARPVLVSDVAGNPEWAEDGRSGFVCAASSARSIAQNLERAWQAREKLPEMGRAAREGALQRFDPRAGATFLQVLRDAAQPNTSKNAPKPNS